MENEAEFHVHKLNVIAVGRKLLLNNFVSKLKFQWYLSHQNLFIPGLPCGNLPARSPDLNQKLPQTD
ncbi:hypothetical protein DP113_12950 [Brasilonema octagenarum UFV-E1]|uniref:Uncharacterized protein n=2 Tax=Brasilonema TaxID=383614 RepID=A0A856MHU0_9CYAN|nr:hypothetical protein [Brasilonema octagenarum UFV-OR1]QDL08687.1 hypothetical protein DP114_13010 [Brasilonema sennae CENA114]QDL15043.1 hypothetical protein DP113_12950 [Brasilonema octagenarum UFV-E1]